jgi:hypothetical protein
MYADGVRFSVSVATFSPPGTRERDVARSQAWRVEAKHGTVRDDDF